MPKKGIENYINEALANDAIPLAMEFVSCLKTHEMQFDRGGGYWENHLYWCVNCEGRSVCFILIEENSWTVWCDDSDEDTFETAALDDGLKEIAWSHVEVCENVEICFDGCARRRKVIFGREFPNVCGTTMRFDNPVSMTVDCMKAVMEIRKNYIQARV